MLITDHQLSIVKANSSAHNYLGTTHVAGRNLTEFIHPTEVESLSTILTPPFEDAQTIGRLIHSDGQSLCAEMTVIRDDEQLCWYLRDQDEKIRLKRELDSYRTLPKEYGHDINNLLSVIISSSELALLDIEPDSQLQEDVSDILEAGYRAASQTRLFMNLGRNLLINKHQFSITELIQDLRPLITDLLGQHAQLEFQFSEHQPQIYGTKISLQGAIAHMCAHARLIRPTGSYILSIDQVDLTQPFSSHVLGVPSQEYVAITLRERNFPFEKNILNTDAFLEPDEAEALTLAWEGIIRAKGSIAQRIDKDGNICISIYLPEVISREQ